MVDIIRKHRKTGRFSYFGSFAAGTSTPILVPTTGEVGLALSVTGGSASVEYTLSSPESVEAGSATWRTWPKGTVTDYADDVMSPPATAVRVVVVSGSATLNLVA